LLELGHVDDELVVVADDSVVVIGDVIRGHRYSFVCQAGWYSVSDAVSRVGRGGGTRRIQVPSRRIPQWYGYVRVKYNAPGKINCRIGRRWLRQCPAPPRRR